MAFKPQNTISVYTDGITDHGVAHEVKWHALVYLWDEVTETGKYEWHYYGTPMPNPLPMLDRYPGTLGYEHPGTLFPPALNDLPEGDEGLYAIAMAVEYNRLSL